MERRYEVFRMEKLKTEGDVATRLRHDMDLSHTNDKGMEVPYRQTADRTRTHLNQYMFKGSPDERFQKSMQRFREKLPEKRRKDAVLGAQCIMSFSREMLEDPNFDYYAYFQDCQNFVRESFGAENVFSWALHLDEATPHVSFFYVPKVDGRLNAREIFGNKKKMAQWQDNFHEKVGKKYGMERGVRKTNIKNQDLRSFYGKLMDIKSELDIPKKGFFQSWDTYKAQIQDLFAPLERAVVSLEQEHTRLLAKQKDLEKREKTLERQKGDLANELGNKYSEGIMFERKRWEIETEKMQKLLKEQEKTISQLRSSAACWDKIMSYDQEEFQEWAKGMSYQLQFNPKKARQTQKNRSQSDDTGYSR